MNKSNIDILIAKTKELIVLLLDIECVEDLKNTELESLSYCFDSLLDKHIYLLGQLRAAGDVVEKRMGDFRFYFTNPGVVKSTDELPNGWGVYECVPGKKPIHRFGVRLTNAGPLPLKGNKDNEITVMRSIIRRMKKETK